jgi:hypothetical protein
MVNAYRQIAAYTVIFSFASIILGLLIYPSKAYAYLDPGTGSYVLQLLIASAIGALFALKMFWKRVSTFFKNLVSRTPDSDK